MPISTSTSTVDRQAGRWLAAFRAAVVSPRESIQLFAPRAFKSETLRQVVRLAGDGSEVRVRLTNRYGLAPLVIGAARLADHAAGSAVVPGSDRALRFDGATTVTVPPGEEVVSDPLERAVVRGADLALTLYLPEPTGLATYQADPRETAYVVPGDSTRDDRLSGPDGAAPEAVATRSFVAGIDVLTSHDGPVVVTFGDSFIEGTGTTSGAHRRISDRLAARLDGWVLNTGIAGNRLLRDEVGERGLGRLGRDVLDIPGVTHLLVHLGLNDLGLPGTVGEARPGAGDVVAGLADLAARAHDAGLVVVGATLGPTGSVSYEGYDAPEVRRAAAEVDDWVRRGGAFDSVVDVAAGLADPDAPDHLRPAYDSGDGLHFNDAGALAVAEAIDLAPLRTPGCGDRRLAPA